MFSIITNFCVYASWETDFDVFMIGEPEKKEVTFMLLGRQRTKSVSEIKEMLKKSVWYLL